MAVNRFSFELALRWKQTEAFRRTDKMVEVEQKGTFHKFTYHGVDLCQLLDMPYERLTQLAGRRSHRPGLNRAAEEAGLPAEAPAQRRRRRHRPWRRPSQ
ncbi:hypothetical protein HPG69_018359 [Diceros bicornis minor]|uniref:40S ribosomal protein S15 n=1 Tax=Diceros bicornis minor TaxID=77932 RepID=A0A7J7FG89_DICBM|nr:hypothetical protein HPG69_018359 [Diceros bicornis minor]